MGSIFKKPETIMYPVVEKPLPKGLKGHIVITEDSCILCGACQRVCTADAIEVERKERTWTINHFRCVQCSACVEACPTHSLEMDPHRPPVAREISLDVRQIPEKEKPQKKQAAPKEAAEAKKAASAGNQEEKSADSPAE